MRRTTSALVIAAAMVLGGTALAGDPPATPPAAKADAKKADNGGKPSTAPGKDTAPGKSDSAPGKADTAPGKADTAPGKAGATPGKADTAPGKDAKPGENPATDVKEPAKADDIEKVAKKKAQRDAARAKVVAALKGQPMNEAMKQELRRHAQRVARLERISSLATEAKDDAATDRAKKLTEKENARHDRWMQNFDAKAETKVGAK